MGKKFVGLGGLKHFWTKAKTWIAGQITSEVTAKIAEIVANAPEDLDTLKEIADWISTHANDASAMNTQINTNKNDIAALQTSVAGKAAASHTHDDRYYTETEVDTKLSGKSDTGHTHTKSQITDFPTSLPANGGTASKVGNSLTFGSKTYDGSSAQTITASDLGALTAHQTIKQDGITGATVNRFGTCSTAAATAAKTVSITDGTFSLEAGARVSVKFSNANTADTPTLNVANKGAKNIFHKGAKITTGVNKALLAGVCDFIYDGTQWHLIGNYIDTNTTYSAATQSSAGLMSADDKTKLDNLEKYTKEYKVSDVTSETTKYIKLGEFNPTEGGNISCRITGDNFDDTIDINILGGNFDNTSVCGHYSTKSKRTQGIRVSGTISQNIGIYIKISQLTTATVKVAVDKKYQSRISLSESGLGQYEGVLTDISFSSYNGLFGNLTGDVTGSSGSAGKLTTARKTYVTLGTASTTTTRDWSGDTTIPVSGTLPVANGGTGVTSQADINKAFIGNLTVGNDNVTDGTEFVSSYASDNGFADPSAINKPYKRQFVKVWNYIKDKISSVLGLTADNYGGKASTAGTADNARNMYYQNLDLSSLDKTKFYPLVCYTGNNFAEVAICSESAMGSAEYNQNRIHFDISTQGWSDLRYTLNIREYTCYENNEITIGCIGRGIHSGAWAIWLRGGIHYTCFSRDADLSLKTSDYTYGDETYTVGTNYYGGSNSNVEVVFTPQSTITHGSYSSRAITAPVIQANNKMIIPIGAPSSLEDGCIWIQ